MRFEYYEQLKSLAREKRQQYGITGPRVLRTDMKRIFKAEGIQLDYWHQPFKKLRGAYFHDELGSTIMIKKDLPSDPCVFTMAHEYKHHLTDQDRAMVTCENNPANEAIEIGAEIFAAEFLFPEGCFREEMERMGVGLLGCTAEVLVRLKSETKTTLSYAGLTKLAEWLKFAPAGSLPKSGWRKLEDKILGIPFYRTRPTQVELN